MVQRSSTFELKKSHKVDPVDPKKSILKNPCEVI